MKRRREQERDEAVAREQAEARREALLAELKAHQAGEPEPAVEAAEEKAPAEEAPADEGSGSEALPAD